MYQCLMVSQSLLIHIRIRHIALKIYRKNIPTVYLKNFLQISKFMYLLKPSLLFLGSKSLEAQTPPPGRFIYVYRIQKVVGIQTRDAASAYKLYLQQQALHPLGTLSYQTDNHTVQLQKKINNGERETDKNREFMEIFA